MAHTINRNTLAPAIPASSKAKIKTPSPAVGSTARSHLSIGGDASVGTAITPTLFNTAPRESIQRSAAHDVDDKVLQLVCGPQDALRPKRGSPQERCFFSRQHPEYAAYNLRTALDHQEADQRTPLNGSATSGSTGGVSEDIVFSTSAVNAEELGKSSGAPAFLCKTEIGFQPSKDAFVDLTPHDAGRTTATAVAPTKTDDNQKNDFELGYAAYEAGDYRTAFKHFDLIKQNCLVAAYLMALMLYDKKLVADGNNSAAADEQQQQAIDLMFDIYVRASMNDAATSGSATTSIGNREIKHAACYLLGIAHETGVGKILARNDECAMKWWRDAACDLIQLTRESDGTTMANGGRQSTTIAAKLAEDDLYQPPTITDFGVLCQVKLGKYYHLQEDGKSATFWFRQAALNGHLESQATLGMILYLRKEKEREKELANENEALKVLKEAAESGSLNASAMLAAIYFDKRMFDMCVRWASDAVNYAFANAADDLDSWKNLAAKCDSTVTALKNCVASSLCYYSFCLRHALGNSGGGGKTNINQANNKDIDKADECAKLAMQFDPTQTKRIMQFVH